MMARTVHPARSALASRYTESRWNRLSATCRNVVVLFGSRLPCCSAAKPSPPRGSLPSREQDEIEIADIDDQAERLACDEYRIAAIERIDQQQRAAADREEPERHRHH